MHGIDPVYDSDDLEEIDNSHEDLCEHFLDEIFDAKARLPSLEWCDQVAKKANWLFNPTKLREKIADLAKVGEKFLKED